MEIKKVVKYAADFVWKNKILIILAIKGLIFISKKFAVAQEYK